MGATSLLLKENLKSWFGGRGFLLVCVAALVPMLLTGSWVATHRADVAATGVTWDADPPVLGKMFNITATVVNKGNERVGPFNVTVLVGRNDTVSSGLLQFQEHSSHTTHIDGLAPHASATASLNWTPSNVPGSGLEYGTFTIAVLADVDDTIPEVEEANNLFQKTVQVQLGDYARDFTPAAPGNPALGASAPKVDVVMDGIQVAPAQVYPGGQVTFSAALLNRGPDNAQRVKVHWSVLNATSRLRESLFDNDSVVDVPANGRVEVSANWTAPFPGTFLAVATSDPSATSNDTNGGNNGQFQAFFADHPQSFKDPPERYTIKRFYTAILSVLYLRILIPLIGLFYAAGVIADEREKGNLVYLLTRPIPRPLVPFTKFVSSFFVSAIAVVVGVVATYLLLLGTPSRDLGYLTTPLLVSLLALFAYGAFFVFLGVHIRRPYLAGLGFIAWETTVLLASTELLVNNRPLAAPWMQHLTISRHLLVALQGWSLDHGLTWLPEHGKALEAFWIALAIGVGGIVAAVWSIKRREFDE